MVWISRWAVLRLHPGPVATGLSADFAANHPTISARASAPALLEVMNRLTPADSGTFRDWKGRPVPWGGQSARTWRSFIASAGVSPVGHRSEWWRWGLKASTKDRAKSPMTDTTMELSDFLPRDDHEDCLHGIVEAVLQLIIQTDAECTIWTQWYERSVHRT